MRFSLPAFGSPLIQSVNFQFPEWRRHPECRSHKVYLLMPTLLLAGLLLCLWQLVGPTRMTYPVCHLLRWPPIVEASEY